MHGYLLGMLVEVMMWGRYLISSWHNFSDNTIPKFYLYLRIYNINHKLARINQNTQMKPSPAKNNNISSEKRIHHFVNSMYKTAFAPFSVSIIEDYITL